MPSHNDLDVLKQGVDTWNAWRERHTMIRTNLCNVDLRKACLCGANFKGTNLSGAILTKARLGKADLRGADLRGANLTRAVLRGAILKQAALCGADLSMADLRKADLCAADLSLADLREARLSKAHLRGAKLIRTDLLGSILFGADLDGAILSETVLADTLLMSAEGLDNCQHRGPSIIDHRTLLRSGSLPLSFLQGCGLPDNLIEYLPSLLNQPIQYYSCFISYSSTDEEFVQRLYADLQTHSVRCWFAPADMRIGAKILDTLYDAIRLRDKVLLILSQKSIASDWVEDEVSKAFDEERIRRKTVVVPIRIDAAVLETKEAWANKLRSERNIGDFSHWKQHDSYQKSLDRLLRDLKLDEQTK